MGYLMEAILLILAVVLPLSFVLIFLRRLISNLGDATHAHQLKNENKMNFRSNKLKNT
ncbi:MULTISPECIES: hypothetical protein [Bacillus]|uniref:hypothetical protein n=1 Tax=Bacillus TaxID=1386 RepID=UPI000B7F5F41|nr:MULTISPECIES: hypothetical protein [Bacillus]OXL96443.1 hypothetical protein B9T53_13770 [Bacillus sp. KbaL1]